MSHVLTDGAYFVGLPSLSSLRSLNERETDVEP